ncbi:MAG: hypothetical protein ACOYIK_02895 [Coriobacteriales bacterium]|jgi:hypothetical protein
MVMANVYVSVDDTDDLTKTTSTGAVAQHIAKCARELGGVVRYGISRHQLLLREDVPYTSHNSAMAFDMMIDPAALEEFAARAVRTIFEMRAETSNPGFCIAAVPKPGRSESDDERRLVDFGRKAKVEFCPVSEAAGLANTIPWVRLESHGGNGDGIVGALAGVGLRLSGNDGRFRGKWDLVELMGSSTARAGELEASLSSKVLGPVHVIGKDGTRAPRDADCQLVEEAKPILDRGVFTLVCEEENGFLVPYCKDDLEEIGNVDGSWSKVCDDFEIDNDLGECEGMMPSCRNCLHRRWTRDSFECTVSK